MAPGFTSKRGQWSPDNTSTRAFDSRGGHAGRPPACAFLGELRLRLAAEKTQVTGLPVSQAAANPMEASTVSTAHLLRQR